VWEFNVQIGLSHHANGSEEEENDGALLSVE